MGLTAGRFAPLELLDDPAPASGGARLVLGAPGQPARLTGRLSGVCVVEVREQLHRWVDDGEGDLLLDLAGARVSDCFALGLLVGVHERAHRRGRRLVLLDVPPRLEALVRRTRLHRVLVRRTSAGAPPT